MMKKRNGLVGCSRCKGYGCACCDQGWVDPRSQRQKPADMKETLTSTRKPDVTHVREPIKAYIARACEYGSAKGYERSNFLRSTGGGLSADFERLRAYLAAASRHIGHALDMMEAHQANDPRLVDVEGMRTAAYAADLDSTPGTPVGASLLPSLCGGSASIMMAISQAADCGLLPCDPGQPWTEIDRRATTSTGSS